jgi:biopolymer transport protein ExbD
MRIHRKIRQAEEFQMAPMIDMVFLLLVFFMCVSSLAQADRHLPVDLPVSAESDVPDDLSNRGVISVKADGTFFLGAAAITPGDLASRIGAELKRRPDLRIQIRADGGTPFSFVRKVLKLCAEAGATEIIYATHQVRD